MSNDFYQMTQIRPILDIGGKMNKEDRYYRNLCGKPVIATLRFTKLKFIALYAFHEVQDDYDDTPSLSYYEFEPYLFSGYEIVDVDDILIYNIEPFDPEIMDIEPLDYDEMTKEEKREAKSLYDRGYIISREILRGKLRSIPYNKRTRSNLIID